MLDGNVAEGQQLWQTYGNFAAVASTLRAHGLLSPYTVGSPIAAYVGATVNQILLGAPAHGMPPFARSKIVRSRRSPPTSATPGATPAVRWLRMMSPPRAAPEANGATAAQLVRWQ